MKKFKVLSALLLICFIATGVLTPVSNVKADISGYDWMALQFDPVHEGAQFIEPTSEIPDIPPDKSKFMLDNSDPEVADFLDIIERGGVKLGQMQAVIVDDEWLGVTYWVESTKAAKSSTIKYRTKRITYQLGEFKGSDTYARFQTDAPEGLQDNGKWYSANYITADNILSNLKAHNPGNDEAIDKLITSEEFLYIGAVVEVIQTTGSSEKHLAWIDTYSGCQSIGAKYFGSADVKAIQSRWQPEGVLAGLFPGHIAFMV